MKKRLSVLFFIFSICSFCFTVQAAEEKSSGREFVMQLSDKFPELHPHLAYENASMQIITATSEGLFTYDPYTALPVKALAKDFKVTGNTWRFEIRDDAKFENGDEITAETIKQSWMSLLSPDAGFTYASLLDCVQGAKDYRTGKNANSQNVAITVESKYVLSLYLCEPTPHLPSILCNAAFAAVHPSQLAYAKKNIGVQKKITAKNYFKPISSGPFKIVQADNKQIIFGKNENYWDAESVKLNKIVLRFDLSADEEAACFNVGELQWSKNANLSQLVGTQIISYAPMFATSFLFFNARDPNTANEKVRQALLLAVPYEDLRKNFQLPAETFVFPLAGYPRVKGINEQNVSQAKKILSELKLSDEKKVLTIKVYDYDFQKELAEVLQKAWEAVGFTVTVKTIAAEEDLQAALSAQDYSMSLLTWIADFADPMGMLELFKVGSTLNMSGWSDKNFDAIILAAGNETDRGKRYKKLSEAENYLLKSGMVLPLGFSLSLNVIDISEIGGWYPNALDVHPFKFLNFKQKTLAPGFI